MRITYLLLAAFLLSFSHSNAGDVQSKAVYGTDKRLDYYQVTNPSAKLLMDATALMISPGSKRRLKNGDVLLKTEVYGENNSLCKDEAFWSQPAIEKQLLVFSFPNCSAFLVGPDLMATAGHCMVTNPCGDMSFVFGYKMNDPTQARIRIPAKDVYRCKEVVASDFSIFGGPDFSLVRLDRPVPDRMPIKMAQQPAQIGERVVMIGYPMGLPLKIDQGAQVRSVSSESFISEVDAYDGNSGSVILRESTGEALGILVDGESDFVNDKRQGCQRSKVCSPGDCKGETSTDISFIKNAIAELAK